METRKKFQIEGEGKAAGEKGEEERGDLMGGVERYRRRGESSKNKK
jgi:hypothetical protein